MTRIIFPGAWNDTVQPRSALWFAEDRDDVERQIRDLLLVRGDDPEMDIPAIADNDVEMWRLVRQWQHENDIVRIGLGLPDTEHTTAACFEPPFTETDHLALLRTYGDDEADE